MSKEIEVEKEEKTQEKKKDETSKKQVKKNTQRKTTSKENEGTKASIEEKENAPKTTKKTTNKQDIAKKATNKQTTKKVTNKQTATKKTTSKPKKTEEEKEIKKGKKTSEKPSNTEESKESKTVIPTKTSELEKREKTNEEILQEKVERMFKSRKENQEVINDNLQRETSDQEAVEDILQNKKNNQGKNENVSQVEKSHQEDENILQKGKTNKNNLKNEEKIKSKKEEKKKKKSKKIWLKILLTIFILGITGINMVAFLFYGPYTGFRDWWITTAMTTMRHKYLATWFFSTEIINEVLSKNRVDEVQGTTDTTLIDTNSEDDEPQKYANRYEKQILGKNLDKEEYDIYADEEEYRIIKIEGKKYNGYLAVVYDPSKVKTVASRKVGESGQYLTTMVQENDAILGINGGGFLDEGHNGNGSMPHGITISNGKVITSNIYSGVGGLIGFDSDNKLVLGKMNLSQAKKMKIRDAVTWGPYLIINGEKSKILGNGGWGTAPRTAIGQRQDGIVLMLVIDGRRATKPGADMNDLMEIMERYGAYNAVNLDGGTSSAMVVGDKIINDPIDSAGAHRTRYIATGFILTK